MQREESATSLSPAPAELFPRAPTDPTGAGLGALGSYLGLELIFRTARDQTKGAGGGPLPLSPPIPCTLPYPHSQAS